MIPVLPNHRHCCGCSACFSVCPKRAITMVPDQEGFLQPVINQTVCSQCGMCRAICPVLQKRMPREPYAVYAVKALDDELRLKSSSGGLFSLLARNIIAQQGIVYGAGWKRPEMCVVHKAAENEEQLDDLRGSKYVQSDMGDTYRQLKTHLDVGRHVLFTGCPCQVAGLKSFLKTDYENLLCVDLVCHGVPSPMVFKAYIDAFGQKWNEPVKTVDFREKKHGWKNFSLTLKSSGMLHSVRHSADPYITGFLRELYNRPSCHACRFRSCRSGSDLILADYWEVEKRFPEMDDDQGTSLLLVMTEKGRLAFQAIQTQVKMHLSDYQHAKSTNLPLNASLRPNRNRTVFFKKLRAGYSVESLSSAYTREMPLMRGLRWAKKVVYRIIGKTR